MTAENQQRKEAEDLWAVQETLRGNPTAFETIVRKYTPVLYSLAYRMLGQGGEAEDAVQEIFEKAFKNLARFRINKRFFPWLYTIGVNHLRSLKRRGRRRSRLRIVSSEPARILESVASSQGNPVEQSELREGERLAQRALETLRAEYREVFVLRQIQNFSVQEVSEILGIPEGTVKTYLHRARRAMVDFLTGSGWE